jgi:predicted O-linked N-acetylglucosamine transferase (SPINDLY family)
VHAHQGSHRERFRAFFAEHGVDPGRIEFVGTQKLAAYFATYGRLDIALDPFPFGGGTTSCDALWMGVPFVTLQGDTVVSRAGATLLRHVDLTPLATKSPEEYVRVAIDLARNTPHLAELRRTLRERMQRSALMDTVRFARDIEMTYRSLWQAWCRQP